MKNLLKMTSIPLGLLYDKVQYCIQYADYGEDEWTAPCLLTEERAEKFCDDASVKRVKILSDDQEWILDLI